MIALILGVGVVWPLYSPPSGTTRYFLPIIILWITIGILHLILVRLLPSASWLGALQVSCDVGMITAIVYATGLQDSNFTSALPAGHHRGQHFVLPAAHLPYGDVVPLLPGLNDRLVYSGKIPRTSVAAPTFETIRLWFLSNTFGFLAVAYLASLLAVSLRKKSSGTRGEKGRAAGIPGFHRRHHSFHARRAGDHRPARVVWCFSIAPERKFSAAPSANCAAANLREVSPEFWLEDMSRLPERLSLATRNRSADSRRAAALFGDFRFASAYAGCGPQWVRHQFSGSDRTAPPGTGSCHQRAHGCCRTACRPRLLTKSASH